MQALRLECGGVARLFLNPTAICPCPRRACAAAREDLLRVTNRAEQRDSPVGRPGHALRQQRSLSLFRP